MSNLILAIVVFVVFSVITDAIESMKKKRQQEEELPRRPQPNEKRPAEEKKPGLFIPPIFGAPKKKDEASVYKEPKPASALSAIEKKYPAKKKPKLPEPEIVVDSNYAVAKPLKSADIHTNVLLSAVAYAQILQPPKAYQYMATKSCKGDWQNNK